MIAILGGTFDPIHFGHLRPALEIAEKLSLKQLRVIPSATPPHRWKPVASQQHRLQMVKLAIQGIDNFVIDDREYHRQGASYTIDTLKSLREEISDDDPLCMIIGLDAFDSFNSWLQWQQILDYSHIIVSSRPGYDLSDSGFDKNFQQWIKKHLVKSIDKLHTSAAGKLCFFDVTQLDISATNIRNQLHKGQSCHFLTPENVVDYIQQHKLYI